MRTRLGANLLFDPRGGNLFRTLGEVLCTQIFLGKGAISVTLFQATYSEPRGARILSSCRLTTLWPRRGIWTLM